MAPPQNAVHERACLRNALLAPRDGYLAEDSRAGQHDGPAARPVAACAISSDPSPCAGDGKPPSGTTPRSRIVVERARSVDNHGAMVREAQVCESQNLIRASLE